MDTVECERTCPKCGERMCLLPSSEWSLWGLRTIEAICPNCLHVERFEGIVAERDERGDK